MRTDTPKTRRTEPRKRPVTSVPLDHDPLTWPLAGLLAEPPGAARTFPLAGITIPLDDDLRLAGPIEGSVTVRRTNRGVLVTARLKTSLAESCSRCLRDVDVPLTLDIDEEVLPSIDLATGKVVDTSAEPEVLRLSAHHELDLEPVIREAISLAEPIAPLCRPDCPGLCPECGLELSSGPHDHGDADIDPRLEALRAFRVATPDDGARQSD
jgi:uncharacterized protein